MKRNGYIGTGTEQLSAENANTLSDDVIFSLLNSGNSVVELYQNN